MASLLAACAFFVGVHVVALLGPLLIDAKRKRAYGGKWDRFAAVTSNVPFAAIATGRNSLRLAEIGVWRIAASVAVWLAMLAAHPWLFQVPALP